METNSDPVSASSAQDPSAVATAGRDKQLRWAYNAGMHLWSIRGDDAIPPTLSDAERDDDKQQAWEVVTSEKDSIHYAAETIAEGSAVTEETLLKSMKEGFYSAYDAL